MPIFTYKAYNRGGGETAGTLDAVGIKDAVQRLKRDGLYPAEIHEAGTESRGFTRNRITTHELALTTRQLATLLTSGATLSDALSVLAEEEGNVRLKSILHKVKDKIAEGMSLASALDSHPDVFSGIYKGMVSAGEASGSLDKVLPRIADYLEARAKIIRDVRSALIYPFFMIIVGVGVLSFLFIFVIPKITRIFEDTKSALPWITITLLWIVNLFRYYWHLIIIVTGGIILGVRRYIKSPKGKGVKDRTLLKIPWLRRLILQFYITSLTRTLGSLLKGGIPILKALDMTKSVLNHMVFNEIIDIAIKDIMGGSSLSLSLKKSRVIPPIVIHMITVGESGGNLDDMLLNTADTYEQEFNTGIKRGLTIMEPVLILLMGMVGGYIVLSILLPIFQLNQIIR